MKAGCNENELQVLISYFLCLMDLLGSSDKLFVVRAVSSANWLRIGFPPLFIVVKYHLVNAPAYVSNGLTLFDFN